MGDLGCGRGATGVGEIERGKERRKVKKGVGGLHAGVGGLRIWKAIG